MSELADLERRITEIPGSWNHPPCGEGASQPASAALEEALEAERATNAQLAERLKALRARETRGEIPALEARIAELTRQLDEQGLELHRMRKSTIQLREALRAITEQTAGSVEGNVINKASSPSLRRCARNGPKRRKWPSCWPSFCRSSKGRRPMPEIDITIGGRSFGRAACQPGEEHFLRTAAQMLDAEAAPIVTQMGRLPEARLLLTAGLMLADRTAGIEDELRVLKARLAELDAQGQPAPVRIEVPVIPPQVEEQWPPLQRGPRRWRRGLTARREAAA